MAWTFKSNTYDGRYLKLTIDEIVEPTLNRSKLPWTLSSVGGNDTYYTISATSIVINGVEVYSKEKTSWTDEVFPAAKGSTSGTAYVTHDTNGKKTITVEFITSVYVGYPLDYGSDSVVLTDIDRTAPTVTCQISNITSAGFKISGTSSVTADKWDYSTDDGKTWTEFSTTAGTAANVTVSTLSPNTTYSVKVRARKKSNYVYGTSGSVSAKTLGASVIVKTYNFAADAASPAIKVNLTVYDGSYYHKLSVKAGTDTVFEASLGQCSAGTADRSYSMTAAQRTALLEAMSTSVSKSFDVCITTYSDSGYSKIIGTESKKAVTASTSAALSAPTFEDFSYVDVQAIVAAAMGSDKALVQNYSRLRVVCEEGTARNGASISGYSASIGNASASGSGTILDVGAIGSTGNLTLTVACTDSRGYATTIKKTVTVLKYADPQISSLTLRRMNEIEGLVQLAFGGSISSLKVDGGTEKNEVTDISYRYKKTSDDEWSDPISLIETASVSGTSFSFASLELIDLDPELSYNFCIIVQDKLGELSLLEESAVLPQGIPVVAIRKRNDTYQFPRVGINNPHPVYPLDVGGDIAMNGVLVLGFVKNLTDENFDFLTVGGYYYYGGSGCFNAPVDTAGWLEVLTNGNAVTQRFTSLAGSIHLRSYTDSWGEWAAH